jgi:hypothetical protein
LLLRRIVAEHAGELGGHGRGAMLMHAAQCHALMLGLDHDGDAARLQDLVDRRDDIAGEPLLRLQAPRIDVEDTRKL